MSELKTFDEFWLEEGQKLVKESFTNLNKHLTNYSTYLKFLSGFYTTAGLTTLLLFKSVCPWIYVGYFLPTILLYVATFKISVGQSIPLETLDLRSPLKINDIYNKLISSLKDDIIRSKRWIVLATLAVLLGGSITIYYLNLEINDKKEEKELADVEKKEADDLLKIENEIYKEFKKAQKFHIITSKTDQKITVTAKLLEDRTYSINYLDEEGVSKSINLDIPKYTDFKREIFNVKSIVDIKELKN